MLENSIKHQTSTGAEERLQNTISFVFFSGYLNLHYLLREQTFLVLILGAEIKARQSYGEAGVTLSQTPPWPGKQRAQAVMERECFPRHNAHRVKAFRFLGNSPPTPPLS